MSRPVLALILLGLCLGLTFGVRTWRQLKTTGSSGFRGLSGPLGSAEWIGGVLFPAAAAMANDGRTTPAGAMLWRGSLGPMTSRNRPRQ